MAGPTHEGTSEPAASGGLPQFDPQWWPGQIFWFLVIFTAVFLLMRYVFVPRIGGTIDARDDKIEGDIAEARALKDQADAEAQTAAAETATARAASQKLAADARAKAQAEIAARLAEEEAKLGQTIEAAEARIRAARDEAMGHVRTIASDTAGAIVARLTGKAASAAELNAAMAGKA
jgi:F-type H+-transporting ATPase subunit b